MSAAEVIEAEGRQPDGLGETDDQLLYNVRVADMEAIAFFVLDNRAGLVRAGYVFTHRQISSNRYFGEFEQLKGLLRRKYGEPATDDVRWLRSLYKDSPDEWGFAVSIGDLQMETTWRLREELRNRPRTKIALKLTGDNYKTDLVITYEWLEPEVREDRDRGVLDDL